LRNRHLQHPLGGNPLRRHSAATSLRCLHAVASHQLDWHSAWGQGQHIIAAANLAQPERAKGPSGLDTIIAISIATRNKELLWIHHSQLGLGEVPVQAVQGLHQDEIRVPEALAAANHAAVTILLGH